MTRSHGGVISAMISKMIKKHLSSLQSQIHREQVWGRAFLPLCILPKTFVGTILFLENQGPM